MKVANNKKRKVIPPQERIQIISKKIKTTRSNIDKMKTRLNVYVVRLLKQQQEYDKIVTQYPDVVEHIESSGVTESTSPCVDGEVTVTESTSPCVDVNVTVTESTPPCVGDDVI